MPFVFKELVSLLFAQLTPSPQVVTSPGLAALLEDKADLALDLPEWWLPGKHDHDLVVGAAR